MVKISYYVFFMMLFLPFVSLAQQDSALVMQDWYTDGRTTYLNVDIANDTAASPSYKAGNRVYVLKNGGIYYWNRSFNVPKGRTIKIKSDGATSRSKYDPIIFLYATGTGTGTQPIQPPGNLVNMLGGTVDLKHIMISGYDELVDSALNWQQGGVIAVPTGGAGSNIYVDSCVLKTWNGNHIRTDGYAHIVSTTNTIFADMGFLGRSNLGAGKAFDFRDVQIDTAIIQNCTFINWQDRIIRHLNAKAPIKNLIFDHNTLINGMSYHGLFDIGKVDSTGGGVVKFTNNLLIDPFSLGNDTDVTRQAEFTDSGEKDEFGKGRMTWIQANPNNAVNWDIRNNYYAISDSGKAFLDKYPYYKNEGPALTWNMNARLAALGKDTLKTFQKITIKPVKVPMLMTNFNRWYFASTGGNKTKQTNNFTQSATPGKWTYDYDRKGMWWYADSLNCSFRASVNLSAASTDGKVIGDPRWSYLGATGGSVTQDSALVMQDWYTDGRTTYLNVDIANDTAASPSYKAGNRVYVLKNGGIYYWNRSFNVPKGRTIKIKSDGATSRSKYDPIIFLYATGTGTGTQPIQPPGNLVNMLGGTVDLKHIMISGYDELVDSALNWQQGGVIAVPTGGAGSNIYVDSCVLKTWNGNHIRTDGYAHIVSTTNTIFADMGFLGRSNLGAGKAFDFRDVQIDTAIIQNCTFINWQDRIIRHLNAKAPIKNLIFDHNTLINGMSYHGLFDIGKVDSTGGGVVKFTNNLLIDPFSLGNDTDVTRQAEFTDSGEKDEFGKGRMTWIQANPNNAVNWDIRNNYYAISDSGKAFLDKYPYYKNEGPALTWNMNARLAALGKDTLKTFQKITIKPVKVPMLMTNFNRWYFASTGGNKTKQTNNFTQSATPGKWTYDYDRKGMWWYADSLNCSFRASVNLSAASTDGKVIGDPRWSYLGATVGVNDINMIPMRFSLEQNYPNPFNPSTKIEYTIPTASKVTLKIFNLLGQVVATLVDEKQEANSYVKEFDASLLSSGIYFYQITAGNFNSTKKMILMK